MKIEFVMKNVLVCILAISIPCLLILNVAQVKKYVKLEKETQAIEKKQYEVIEENKRLVATISKLASPDRIELLAQDTLHMEKANPEDIIRVEIKGRKGE